MSKLSSILFSSVAALSLAPSLALAQATPPADAAASGTQVETIVVTARKRSEDLLTVPVAVSALTRADLEVRNIQSLDDVAKFTPGLTDDQANAGGARADRSFQQLIIRGMNPSSTVNPTASIFINGVPVASADLLQSLDDIQRVEVLKGPQSAYFGRETFAGAINVITVDPGATLGANVSATAGTRNTYKITGSVTLPVAGDKLTLRLGGSYDTHDGSYKNAFDPSQTLGDQSTATLHATIIAKPFDNLTIKAYGMYLRDNDGPAATGIYLATGAGAFNQGNCASAGSTTTNYFCGTLPALIRSVSPAQVTTIAPSVNFANATQSFLNNPGGIVSGSDLVKKFGLVRNAYHGDLDITYDIPSLGVALTYLGGFNHNDWSEVSDLANLDGGANGQYPGYTGFPYEVQSRAHDMSHELRIATDGKKPFRALLGASYIDAYAQEALGVAFVGPGAMTPSGPTQSKTAGVFFSLAYDITPQLTIDFDGRYQSDKEIAFVSPGVISAQGTSNNFLPRASVQYKFDSNAMAYFTFSQGVNPGVFNSQYSTLPTASQAELNANGSAGGLLVKPEKITNYELGVKGRFLDGHLMLSADVYYDKWKDQLNANTYIFSAADPANPYNNGIPGSGPYLYGYTDNSASSTAKGVEVDATFIPLAHVTANLAGAINNTKYDALLATGTNSAPYLTFNAAGKHLPNAPEASFAAGLQYENALPIAKDATWFARADFIYRDGVYVQSTNTVKTPNVGYLNLRVGANFGRAKLEVFVNNVTNNRSPTSGFEDVNFGGFFAPTAIMVGLPQLITAGLRLSFKY